MLILRVLLIILLSVKIHSISAEIDFDDELNTLPKKSLIALLNSNVQLEDWVRRSDQHTKQKYEEASKVFFDQALTWLIRLKDDSILKSSLNVNLVAPDDLDASIKAYCEYIKEYCEYTKGHHFEKIKLYHEYQLTYNPMTEQELQIYLIYQNFKEEAKGQMLSDLLDYSVQLAMRNLLARRYYATQNDNSLFYMCLYPQYIKNLGLWLFYSNIGIMNQQGDRSFCDKGPGIEDCYYNLNVLRLCNFINTVGPFNYLDYSHITMFLESFVDTKDDGTEVYEDFSNHKERFVINVTSETKDYIDQLNNDQENRYKAHRKVLKTRVKIIGMFEICENNLIPNNDIARKILPAYEEFIRQKYDNTSPPTTKKKAEKTKSNKPKNKKRDA